MKRLNYKTGKLENIKRPTAFDMELEAAIARVKLGQAIKYAQGVCR